MQAVRANGVVMTLLVPLDSFVNASTVGALENASVRFISFIELRTYPEQLELDKTLLLTVVYYKGIYLPVGVRIWFRVYLKEVSYRYSNF